MIPEQFAEALSQLVADAEDAGLPSEEIHTLEVAGRRSGKVWSSYDVGAITCLWHSSTLRGDPCDCIHSAKHYPIPMFFCRLRQKN
jgi:hypothetical protein